MWSSFKIFIEDLRLSSNVAVTVTKNRKLLSKKHILKSGKKPVATKLYENDAYDALSDLWLLTLVAYEKWLLFFFNSLNNVKSNVATKL